MNKLVIGFILLAILQQSIATDQDCVAKQCFDEALECLLEKSCAESTFNCFQLCIMGKEPCEQQCQDLVNRNSKFNALLHCADKQCIPQSQLQQRPQEKLCTYDLKQVCWEQVASAYSTCVYLDDDKIPDVNCVGSFLYDKECKSCICDRYNQIAGC